MSTLSVEQMTYDLVKETNQKVDELQKEVTSLKINDAKKTTIISGMMSLLTLGLAKFFEIYN